MLRVIPLIKFIFLRQKHAKNLTKVKKAGCSAFKIIVIQLVLRKSFKITFTNFTVC